MDDIHGWYVLMICIDDIHGRGPPVKKSSSHGENMTIYRVNYAESHGPHGKVTALKKRWVIGKQQRNIYIYINICIYIYVYIYIYKDI